MQTDMLTFENQSQHLRDILTIRMHLYNMSVYSIDIAKVVLCKCTIWMEHSGWVYIMFGYRQKHVCVIEQWIGL